MQQRDIPQLQMCTASERPQSPQRQPLLAMLQPRKIRIPRTGAHKAEASLADGESAELDALDDRDRQCKGGVDGLDARVAHQAQPRNAKEGVEDVHHVFGPV